MFDRLFKGFFVTLVLPLVSLGMAYIAWERGPLVSAGIAVLAGAVALVLGQWMWWLDRVLPGLDRGKAADRLLQLSWFLPLANTLVFAIAENSDPARGESAPALTALVQAGILAGALLLAALRLRPVFSGPPCPQSLETALLALGLRRERRGPFRSPVGRGPGSSLEVSWTNDANGAVRMTATLPVVDAGLRISRRGLLAWSTGVTTGDAAFDAAVRIEGDRALVHALFGASVRQRVAVSVADGASLGERGWRYDGPIPTDPLLLLQHFVEAADATGILSDREIDAALLRNATEDPVAEVRLASLVERLRRGKEAPAEALKDADARVRVLAAAALAPARLEPARNILLTEPAGVSAGLLDACGEMTAVAFVLVSTIAERGGPSTARALDQLALRTKDDALKAAAREAIERVNARGETDSGRLSVSEDAGGEVSVATGQGAVSIKQKA